MCTGFQNIMLEIVLMEQEQSFSTSLFRKIPFGRSGQGIAWEGLSKYDLNRPNAWYWARLKEFAEKGSREGLLLFHENYFQHNILEAGAHWVDCPWRSSNNINEMDFPEPVPFAGDKRIFVADMFYDINHPVRRELHRRYIRQCLDNFADNPNVIQLTSAEFTGPLHFVQFWLDVIAEWEVETGKKAKVALSTTKDVQDAILADPKRAAVVDIIDIRSVSYITHLRTIGVTDYALYTVTTESAVGCYCSWQLRDFIPVGGYVGIQVIFQSESRLIAITEIQFNTHIFHFSRIDPLTASFAHSGDTCHLYQNIRCLFV